MKQRILGPVVALALVLGVGASSVRADPTNHPLAEPITVTCGSQVYTVSGFGISGLIAESTAVGIPTQFAGSGSYVDPETDELVEFSFVDRVGQGKRTGQQDALTECSFTENFFDPELNADVTIEIVVTVFLTPRGGK